MQDDMMMVLKNFADWYMTYNQGKKNQQNFGVENFPARVFRKTIPLTTAGILSVTGIPFNGGQVEKIYDATTGLSVDGSVKLNFDRGMIDSNMSYKKLVENDSFTLGFSTANSFLSWDAQANVMIDIVFFNDIDFRSGSQKTSIAGQVSVANANSTSLYTKPPIPNSSVAVYNSATNANVYTVPVGKYAKVSITAYARVGATTQIFIGGQQLMNLANAGANDLVLSVSGIVLVAGTIISTNMAGVANAGFLIEEYTV